MNRVKNERKIHGAGRGEKGLGQDRFEYPFAQESGRQRRQRTRMSDCQLTADRPLRSAAKPSRVRSRPGSEALRTLDGPRAVIDTD